MDAQRQQKIESAREALKRVQSGMKVGLGTGSTAKEFVALLGEKLQSGELHDIRCACTSKATEDQARGLGIPTFPLAEVAPLDVAIDGADEIDEQLRLIKGLGNALLREKIVEQAAKRFIVVADETKIVKRLGKGVLPVEVTPFAKDLMIKRFAETGLSPSLRMREGKPWMTDEGNFTVDVKIPENKDIADVVKDLRDQAGVVDTGFFPKEASEAIIATSNGIKVMKR
jgi:ribose 5-phosphate isomerase A